MPHVVRASAELLADAVEHYLFVSSISVYAEQSGRNTEESAVAEIEDWPVDELVMDETGDYGPLKALCEHAVAEVFPRRHSNIRAGLLVGAHDPTGRFTYWPHRVARGGEVLAPAPPERKVQFVDVRDLASWMIDLAERRVSGTFNATHPGRPWGDLLETAREVSGSDAAFTWVPDAFLAEHEVGEWMELPLWLRDPEWIGMHMADVSPAIEAGLSFRPLEETIRETLELAEPTDEAGLSPEREAELLSAWAAHAPSGERGGGQAGRDGARESPAWSASPASGEARLPFDHRRRLAADPHGAALGDERVGRRRVAVPRGPRAAPDGTEAEDERDGLAGRWGRVLHVVEEIRVPGCVFCGLAAYRRVCDAGLVRPRSGGGPAQRRGNTSRESQPSCLAGGRAPAQHPRLGKNSPAPVAPPLVTVSTP